MKRFLLTLFLFVATAPLLAASLVEGRIYMKNGSVVECTGNDRLKMPKKNGKLKVFRDAFRKTKAKEILSPGDIDSVLACQKSGTHTQIPLRGKTRMDVGLR